ncbi:MAG TPA: putative toxin-antitoxin system toxin component, PIN family [Hanamia sp.]
MKVVIDTNCLLSCIGKKSHYRNVFDAFLQNKFTLVVNYEIQLEYEEVFIRFWEREVTYNLLGLFEMSENFEKVEISFKFKLIEQDKDDNKFVDTYIVANADFLVSNDSSITQLKKNSFPPLNILTLKEFSDFLNSQSL